VRLFTFDTLRDYFIAAAIAVAIALLIRSYVVEAYRIPSASMKPTLLPGDVIFVAKWPYRLANNHVPERGDVVVFSDSSNLDFIRRVIGLPGDQVAVKKGHIWINGKELATTPANPGTSTSPLSNVKTTHPKNLKKLKNPPKAEPDFKNSISSCYNEQLPQGKAYEICTSSFLREDFGPETVQKDSVFVVVDYRFEPPAQRTQLQNILEKRKDWDMVPLDAVKGKAMWIWLSIDPYQEFGTPTHWLPKFRFQRMFKEVR